MDNDYGLDYNAILARSTREDNRQLSRQRETIFARLDAQRESLKLESPRRERKQA